MYAIAWVTADSGYDVTNRHLQPYQLAYATLATLQLTGSYSQNLIFHNFLNFQDILIIFVSYYRHMGAYLGKGTYWQLITSCWLYFEVMFQIGNN